MLAIASSRCPNRSTATKNTNQVAIDRKYCSIVKQEILRIRINNAGSNVRNRFRPYFFKSTVIYV